MTPRPITQGSPDYFGLVDQVTSMVTAVVPSSKTVLVVSKGDENLLQLGSRTGWHFPRTDDGRYAGHYPADSDDAIRQLELLREPRRRLSRVPGHLALVARPLPGFRPAPGKRYTCLVSDDRILRDLRPHAEAPRRAAEFAVRSSQSAGWRPGAGWQRPAAGDAPLN